MDSNSVQATHIPEGEYLTIAQIAEQRGVIHGTVQKWLDRAWLPSIHIPGLGHIVNLNDLQNFEPPKQGPKGPRKKNVE